MRDGELRAYTGSRSLQDVLIFSTRMAGAAVSRITGSTDVPSLLSTSVPTLFLLVTADSTADPHFTRLAYTMQGLTAFYHIASPPASFLASHSLSPSSLPAVLHYSLGRPHPVLFPHALSSPSLRPWLDSHRTPLISSLSPDNFEDLTTTPRTLALLIGDERGGHLQPYTTALYDTAERYRGRLSIATVDVGKYAKWVGQFVDVAGEGKLPVLVAFDGYPESVYKPDRMPMSVEDVKGMIEDIVEGRRSPVNSIPWYHPSRYLKVSPAACLHRPSLRVEGPRLC